VAAQLLLSAAPSTAAGSGLGLPGWARMLEMGADGVLSLLTLVAFSRAMEVLLMERDSVLRWVVRCEVWESIATPLVWKAATSKAEPRLQQDWFLMCLQGGSALSRHAGWRRSAALHRRCWTPFRSPG
jgi:hypothetical protein